MLIEDRIFLMLELMLKKCEDKTTENHIGVSLDQYYRDDGVSECLYHLNVSTCSVNDHIDFLFDEPSFHMSFFFGDMNNSEPYILIAFKERQVKTFDRSRILKIRDRVKEIYKEHRTAEFDNILSETMEHFDITEGDIRDVKIKKLIEDE